MALFIYVVLLRPVMLYGIEYWAVWRKMSVSGMRMLGGVCGKTLQDRIRN